MMATETRRLTVVVPVAVVERLRRLQRPDESMNDCVKRLIVEVAK